MVAQVDSSLASHDGGIRISGAHLIIGDALIIAAFHPAVLRSLFLNPVVTRCIVLGELLVGFR
jgi:hypothetical protein